MFARLDYQAGTPVANLLADIVAVLTGTTDKATLSASIIQNTSYIVASEAAGWSVHDASAGTNKKVFSAPNADGSTKYVLVDLSVAGFVGLTAYESWNASTHTGTNPCYYGAVSGLSNSRPTVNLGAGGTLYIGASARYLFCTGYNGAAYDNINSLIAERERVEAWDTLGAGYPLVVQAYQNWNFFTCPRMKGPSGDQISSSAVYSVSTAYGTSVSGTLGRDASFNPEHILAPVLPYVSGSQSLVPQKMVALNAAPMFTTSSYGSSGDEAIVSGSNYFIASSGPIRMAIPKF
jgi:hypothetical protein